MKAKKIKHKGLIFVISGPSGSGKTTLLKELLSAPDLKKLIHKSVSYTTRPKRSCEQSGKDYLFISESVFKRLLREKKILEWTRYLGYYYGTPYETVEKHLHKGRHVALCLDLKGALRIKRLYPDNTITIFVKPPSLETLGERIRKRCHRTGSQEIAGRLKLAKKEMNFACKYNYCLVNQHLASTINRLKKTIKKEIRVHNGRSG